jgi:hypothetical protein
MAGIIDIAKQIRAGTLNLGRQNYSLSLAHAVLQAQYCHYNKITAIEFGVAHGSGLRELCQAAAYYREHCGIEIEVYGFDNAVGLPPQEHGYKDHPEVWRQGAFSMGDPESIRANLPSWAKLIIGDVANTVPDFMATFADTGSKLGFVSIDVDYYSSTVPCLKIFEMAPDLYLPATPVYVDDMNCLITYNEWCGEALAIKEFNDAHELRKIDAKPNFGIVNFHVLHVLDHPIRTGAVTDRTEFEISAKPDYWGGLTI